jgi:hypothetical protein
VVFFQPDFKFHHLPQLLQVGPVNGQIERLVEEWIGLILGVLFERDNTVFARPGRVGDHLLDDRLHGRCPLDEHGPKSLAGAP